MINKSRWSIQLRRWLTPGIGVKRWLMLLVFGVLTLAMSLALMLIRLLSATDSVVALLNISMLTLLSAIIASTFICGFAVQRLIARVISPYTRHQPGKVVDVMAEHNRRQRGFKFVAIGGGTGLPASLRGMKEHTSNITAIVTVADDGGSSGRLRRDMGVPPPGDLRNNIAALADDESLLTRLFQYRFNSGDLEGHSFGNLFIAALANIASEKSGQRNSLAEALVEVERILNIQGRVLPATLDDVYLTATLRLTQSGRIIKVKGESQIEQIDGVLDTISLIPAAVEAYPPSVNAILEADTIVLGPGSLFTSILPNLLVGGIADALRATRAYKIYVCNVATQPVETPDYGVAEHIMALEKHIGRGVFHAVLANNAYPENNRGANTVYVQPADKNHEILQRYEVRYADLTDNDRPWRHDPYKLARAIMRLRSQESAGIVPFIKSAS